MQMSAGLHVAFWSARKTNRATVTAAVNTSRIPLVRSASNLRSHHAPAPFSLGDTRVHGGTIPRILGDDRSLSNEVGCLCIPPQREGQKPVVRVIFDTTRPVSQALASH